MVIRRIIRQGTGVVCGFMLLAALSSATAWADHGKKRSCERVDVEALEFVESGVTGEAELCIKDSGKKTGLDGKMKVWNATWQNAYTVWWVYIDQPGCTGGFLGCIHTFFGDDPLAVFGRMDSAVAPDSGKMKFSNKLDDLSVSEGSQVWLLIFGHGQASDDGRQLARQLLTPEDPTAGAPHLGVDPNGYPVAVAIFEMP